MVSLIVALCVPLLFGGDAYWDHNMRGNADYGQGDWRGAVDEYSQMVRIDPRRQDGYSLRGMTYFKMEQFRLAAADYRAALARSGPEAVNYQNLAYAEDYYGDRRQAIRDFTESITLDPSIPDQPGWTADAHDGTGSAVKGRLWAYYESGQYPLALADCQALIARHPYPSSIAVRGKIYRKMGDYGSAVRDFRAALNEDPRLSFASDQLSQVLGEMRQFSAAASVAEAAAKADPSSSPCRSNVGWWLYRAGELPQAVAADKQALAMGGPQPITLGNLALVYASQGNWAEAKPTLLTAIRVGGPSERRASLVDFQRALPEKPHSSALRRGLALLKTVGPSARPSRPNLTRGAETRAGDN